MAMFRQRNGTVGDDGAESIVVCRGGPPVTCSPGSSRLAPLTGDAPSPSRADMRHAIYPYQPPRALDPNLGQVTGSLKLPIPRNMTVWRAPDGRLVLYSVIAMHEEGMGALEQLGRPAFMVIPHKRHHMDAPFYKARYPDLRVLAENREPANGVAIDGSLEELEPLGVHGERVPGTSCEDLALDLPVDGGRALCLCELVGNLRLPGLVGGILGRIVGPPGGGGFGIARAVRFREVVDRGRVRQWLLGQSRREDLRMLLLGHGAPVVDDVRAALALAA